MENEPLHWRIFDRIDGSRSWKIFLTLVLLYVFIIGYVFLSGFSNKSYAAQESNRAGLNLILKDKGWYNGFFGLCYDNTGYYSTSCVSLLNDKQIKEFIEVGIIKPHISSAGKEIATKLNNQ